MKTRKEQPTPRPWSQDKEKPWSIKDNLGNHFLSLSSPHQRLEEFPANAAHIIKCVNAHEELVERLKEMTVAFHHNGNHAGYLSECDSDVCVDNMNVLAKVKWGVV